MGDRRGAPGYHRDERAPGDTLFGLRPFLSALGFFPLPGLPWIWSWSSFERLVAPQVAVGRVVAIGRTVAMGAGPRGSSFLSRRRGGLQRQRLWCWPAEWEMHLAAPWGGVGGGVRGLCAQPRCRGGLPSCPGRSWGQSPELGRPERVASREVVGDSGQEEAAGRQAGRQGTDGRAPALWVPVGRRMGHPVFSS